MVPGLGVKVARTRNDSHIVPGYWGALADVVCACAAFIVSGCQDRSPGTVEAHPRDDSSRHSEPAAARDGSVGDAGAGNERCGFPEDESVTELIVAATGGEVRLPSGFASIEIPPRALDDDLRITLRRVHVRYAFPPELAVRITPKVSFASPATLSVDTSCDPPPFPWLAPEVDYPPAEAVGFHAVHEGAIMRAKISESGTYEVAWHARGLPDDCQVTPESFVPCGGRLSGTWARSGLCFAGLRPVLYSNVLQAGRGIPGCASALSGNAGTVPEGFEASTEYATVSEWPMTGALRIGQGSFDLSEAVSVIPPLEKIPLDCRDAYGTCEEFGEGFLGATGRCSGTGLCTCEFGVPTTLPAVQATYSVDGTTLRVEGQPDALSCVQGDTLRILGGDGLGPWVEVFTRR